MAMEYTEEQLNHFDKSTLVQLFLIQQSQLKDIDQKLQLLLEQVAVLNNKRFGKSSEKLGVDNQICFMEVDGNIVFFNEAEAVAALDESEEEPVKKRGKKTKGKRIADIRRRYARQGRSGCKMERLETLPLRVANKIERLGFGDTVKFAAKKIFRKV